MVGFINVLISAAFGSQAYKLLLDALNTILVGVDFTSCWVSIVEKLQSVHAFASELCSEHIYCYIS